MNPIINIVSKTHFYMRGGKMPLLYYQKFFFLLNKKGDLQYHVYHNHSTPIKYHVKRYENSYYLTNYGILLELFFFN